MTEDRRDEPGEGTAGQVEQVDRAGEIEQAGPVDQRGQVDQAGAELDGPVEQESPIEQEGQAAFEGQGGQDEPIVREEQREEPVEEPEEAVEAVAKQVEGQAERHAEELAEELGLSGPVPSEAGGGTKEELRATAELKAILEALIFASPDPLTRRAIGKLLTSELAEDIDAGLNELKRDYERPGGLQLVEVAGGYQIVTRSHLHEWVRRLFHERTTQKLTVQALETLAVIAYRQPVTALEVTEIRGVTAAGVLNTLLERHLIKIVGRKKVVGRPFLYATTKEFLIRFGLNEISDLPRVEDMAEALGFEPPLLVERAPGEDALPLDEPESAAGGPTDDESTEVH